LSNDDIKSGKYPDSYKVKRKDKSIMFFADMNKKVKLYLDFEFFVLIFKLKTGGGKYVW
jgi:hypothetical protein